MDENGGLRLAQTAVGQCNCGYDGSSKTLIAFLPE
jgi:hypothetical protein